MVEIDGFRGKFRYDDWANREVLGCLRTIDPLVERSRTWLAHIVGTQERWLGRLNREGLFIDVWPELGLAECEARLEGVRGAWEMYLDGLEDDDFGRSVPYADTKGAEWSTPVREILEHVLLHGAYHRGQIAANVRAEGGEPPNTDFVHYTRQGLLT